MLNKKHSGKVVLLPIVIAIVVCLFLFTGYAISNINNCNYGNNNIEEKDIVTKNSADISLKVKHLSFDEEVKDVFIKIDYLTRKQNSTAWSIDYDGSLKYDKIYGDDSIVFKFYDVKNEDSFSFENFGNKTSIKNAYVIYIDSTTGRLIYVK